MAKSWKPFKHTGVFKGTQQQQEQQRRNFDVIIEAERTTNSSFELEPSDFPSLQTTIQPSMERSSESWARESFNSTHLSRETLPASTMGYQMTEEEFPALPGTNSLPVPKPAENTSLLVSKPAENASLPVSKPADNTSITVSQPADKASLPVSKPADKASLPVSKPADKASHLGSKPAENKSPPVPSNQGLTSLSDVTSPPSIPDFTRLPPPPVSAVQLPPLPAVQLPPLPAVQLPAVQLPPLPAVQLPPLPAVQLPPLPAVQLPPLPAVQLPPLQPLSSVTPNPIFNFEFMDQSVFNQLMGEITFLGPEIEIEACSKRCFPPASSISPRRPDVEPDEETWIVESSGNRYIDPRIEEPFHALRVFLLSLAKKNRHCLEDETSDLPTYGLDLAEGEFSHEFDSGVFQSCPKSMMKVKDLYNLPDLHPALGPIQLDVVSVEILLFIFYFFNVDKVQYAAAKELYNRKWRFHIRLEIWFFPCRISFTSPDFERGDYQCFNAAMWAFYIQSLEVLPQEVAGCPISGTVLRQRPPYLGCDTFDPPSTKELLIKFVEKNQSKPEAPLKHSRSPGRACRSPGRIR